MARRKKTNRPKMAPDDPRRKNLRPPQKKGDPPLNALGKNGHDWTTRFRQFFASESPPDEQLPKGAPPREPGDSRYEHGLRAFFRNVLVGDTQAQKVMIEQLGGRPRASVEVTGKDGQPIETRTSMTTEEAREELAKLIATAKGTAIEGLRDDDQEDDGDEPDADGAAGEPR
jgi:hypothetical protein